MNETHELKTWDPRRLFEAGGWTPPVDIRETKQTYEIAVALAGVKKEDLKIEVKDEVLTISGERRGHAEEEGTNWLRRENSYGFFVRSFALPEGTHPEDVNAEFKEGVLTLRLRKPGAIKSRAVGIKIE